MAKQNCLIHTISTRLSSSPCNRKATTDIRHTDDNGKVSYIPICAMHYTMSFVVAMQNDINRMLAKG